MFESMQGQFLIATPLLTDPNFGQTVSMIVQHDAHGALAIILNRPLGITVSEIWHQISENISSTNEELYRGGPCESMLMALTTQMEYAQIQVLPELYYTADPDHLKSLIEMGISGTQYYIGYAGWGPMQLEAEMETGSWLTVDGNAELVFHHQEQLYDILYNVSDPVKNIMHFDYNRDLPDEPTLN